MDALMLRFILTDPRAILIIFVVFHLLGMLAKPSVAEVLEWMKRGRPSAWRIWSVATVRIARIYYTVAVVAALVATNI